MIKTEDLAAGIMGLTGPYSESLKKATGAIDKAVAAAVSAERERCAKVVDEYLNAYPENLFPAPDFGKHGSTVDSCSAAALRNVLPNIAHDIRALK